MNRQFGAFTGLAMMLIVLNHSITLGLDPPGTVGVSGLTRWGLDLLIGLQTLGMFAVPIFFFVSGSFVAYAAQGDPPRLSLKFLWSSVRHILIPYFLWSVFFYVLVFYQNNEQYSLPMYIKNLLVGYPFHFIPLLIFYYVLSPFLVVVGKRYGTILILLVGAYQLFSLNVVSHGILGFEFPGWAMRFTLPVLRTTMGDWGVYFPLGLVYGLHTREMLPWIKRYAWALLLATLVIFILALLNAFKVLSFPVARYLCVLPFILALPAITRDRIPIVRSFEKLGKRSYGLYLTHLIILDLVLLLFQAVLIELFGLPFLLFPLLFALGLLIPMALMELAARGPTRRVYRYLFG